MRGTKLFVALVFIVLFGGVAYIGFVSRQAAQAGAPHVQSHAEALDREMAECSRIVGGQRR